MKRRADRGTERRTSKVWNYCTQLNETQVECNICKKQLSFHNSTSSMREHLVRRHNVRDTLVGTIASSSFQPMAQHALPSINSVTSTVVNPGMFQPPAPFIVKEEQQDSDMAAEPEETKRARACPALEVGGVHTNQNAVSNPDLNPSSSHSGYSASSVAHSKHSGTGVKECSAKRAGMLTDLILEMVFRDLQPLSVVEERGFGLLLSCLEPHYCVPNTSQLGSLLWHRYDTLKKHLQEHLQSGMAPWSLTLCTEYWQSVAGCEVGGSGRLFLTISAHFVDKDWHLARCVLETLPMPDFSQESSGRGFTLFGVTLKAVLSEFRLPENFVFCIVHNTPWTPAEARGAEDCRLEKEHLNPAGPSKSPQNLPEGSVALHCAGEALKLCIQEGLSVEPVRQALAEVRRIISHFQHEAHAAAALNQKAQASNKAGVCLVLDDPGRWATAIDMCESLLELKWMVSSVLEEQKAAANLADHQWRLLQELVPVLRTVRIAASFLSEDINAPISSLMPCLHGVSRVLEQHIAESNCSVARGVMERVRSGMERHWRLGEEDALLDSPAVLSSFLDPRFKELRFLSPHARSELHDRVKELLSAETPDVEECELRRGGDGGEMEDEGEEDEGGDEGVMNLGLDDTQARQTHPDSPGSCGSNEEVDLIVLHPNEAPRTSPSKGCCKGSGEGDSGSTAGLRKRGSAEMGPSGSVTRDLQHGRESSLVSLSMYDILLGVDPTERMPEIHQQLENYIAEPLCKRSLSPLHWWRSKEHRFPAVARLARKYLAIPATAVPAERAFAPRETPVTQRRATLGSQHLDHILFLHHNCDYVEQLMGEATGRPRGPDKHRGDQTTETLYQSLVSYESKA
ncbi:zinc finger BED domain-containing protein 4 [Osmerus eperlanus]|uniref:zinc finger BED domain-containing protein 4 n=1 Tax=Osmerus eperlanus TaxID=29151 RepID=UPI002E114404